MLSQHATIIASDDGGKLTELFVKAGRMQELVKSFAYASRKMISSKEDNKAWRLKSGKREGKSTEIWDVSVKEDALNGHADVNGGDRDDELDTMN